MTYETIVEDLFQRFPSLRSTYDKQFEWMGDETANQYLVFGSVLIPFLEEALAKANLKEIVQICAFLEDASEAALNEVSLKELIRIEIGEWLGWAANEDLLTPWLGEKTKRICGYVSGLATQRRALKTEKSSGLKSNWLTKGRAKIAGIFQSR